MKIESWIFFSPLKIGKQTKDLGQNDCNKKREYSIEKNGLRDTPLHPIRNLPTTNRLSALY